MDDKAKKKKGTISEEDASILSERYAPTTVLRLLQEVSNSGGKKIDWKAMVEKTKTGISNAREYQMLWRHLAYRHPLSENLSHGDEPLDDDSDLEFEVEAAPPLNSEESAEATAYAKVHIASGLLESELPSSSIIEAPLTINIPTKHSLSHHSETSQGGVSSSTQLGRNIVIPVFVQKQTLPAVPTPVQQVSDTDGVGGGRGTHMPPRKKRHLWSAAEDAELIAVVHKYGESNWANIVKVAFKGGRSASQLSQRWGIIKRRNNLNAAGSSNSTVPQLSQVQLATRKAISAALDLPVGNKRPASLIGGMSLNNVTSNPTSTPTPEPGPTTAATSASRMLTPTTPKPRPPSKKPQTKPTLSPNSMVKATAVAAGARIATPEDAASLLKAAQAINAVHIMPGSGSLIKSSGPGCATSSPSGQYFVTGMAAPPRHAAAYSGAPATAPRSSLKPNTLIVEAQIKQEVKIPNEKKVFIPDNLPVKQVQEDQTCASSNPTVLAKASEKIEVSNQGEHTCISSNLTTPQDNNKVELLASEVSEKKLEHVQQDEACAASNKPNEPVEHKQDITDSNDKDAEGKEVKMEE